MRARATRPSAAWLGGAAAAGFVAGALLMAAPRPAPVTDRDLLGPVSTSVSPHVAPPEPVIDAPPTIVTPTIGADPLEELRKRRLDLPVSGLDRHDLRDTFDEMRAGTRRHEALDILAPRHTPVRAVEDGRVAKLFLSKAGGVTIYQFDPTS